MIPSFREMSDFLAGRYPGLGMATAMRHAMADKLIVKTNGVYNIVDSPSPHKKNKLVNHAAKNGVNSLTNTEREFLRSCGVSFIKRKNNTIEYL